MRMLLQVKMPNEPFNSFVREGTAGEKIGKILEAVHPESVYFTAMDGQRCGHIVVNVKDSSQIPQIAEPFFLTFNASIDFFPCMSQDDLGKSGLDQLGRKWS